MRENANSPSQSDVIDIKDRGGEFYIGDISAKNHYIVIDKKTVVVSEKEGVEFPIKVGERSGCVYTDPEYAKKIGELFDNLVGISYINRMKKYSILTKFADIIFRIFVFGYGKIQEPKINSKIS